MRNRQIRMNDIEKLIEAYSVGNKLLLGWDNIINRTSKEELNDYSKGIGCDFMYGTKKDMIKQLSNLCCPSGY
jgi:hypothetical protein